MKNLTLLPSNNIISVLDSNNNSTLDTGEIATLTNNLKLAQQIIIPGAESFPTFTGSISGRKLIDVNNDRTFTPGVDQPQPNVTHQLDSLESATQTDSLGGYAFSNLLPATYTVKEIVPAGFTRVTSVQPVAVVANQIANFDILNSAGTITNVTGSISGRKEFLT